MTQWLHFILVLAVFGSALVGCKSTPAPPTTGFLSDYSQLIAEENGKMRYVSGRLADYNAFIIDPVQLRTEGRADFDMEKRAEVARYFRQQFIEVLQNNGYRVERSAGTRIARVRLALTDVQRSAWYLNLHPGSKLTGAGTGGASMEGEVIDSVTGEQLGAVVKSGRGNQFELDTFSGIDDVKDVIDRWAKEAEQTLRELREGRKVSR